MRLNLSRGSMAQNQQNNLNETGACNLKNNCTFSFDTVRQYYRKHTVNLGFLHETAIFIMIESPLLVLFHIITILEYDTYLYTAPCGRIQVLYKMRTPGPDAPSPFAVDERWLVESLRGREHCLLQ